jgi:hypothetical protein
MRRSFWVIAGLAALVSAGLGAGARAARLGIDGTAFTIDGKKQFLLGASYYGALGAPDEFISRDLDDLKRLGFNWIRVWATWDAFGNNVSAVNVDGTAREPYLSRLAALVREANRRGLIVDVTLSRGTGLPNQEAHLRAVETLARTLKRYRNVYFDLANERDVGDARFVDFPELKALRDRVKATDPRRLVTASGDGDRKELARYLFEAQVDFIAPHLARRAGSAEQTADKTREYLRWMGELGRSVPVHYQEPFRRGYGAWQPTAVDFCTDLRGARTGGAAGWCFHNGSARDSESDRPRRSFDLHPSEGRLMDQLDAVEREFVKRAAACAK